MADIDAAIGSRLRALRQARSMTMGEVASRLGVQHQQVHKYEMGANRVGVARLFELALLFDVPIGTFFETVQRTSVEEDAPADSRGPALVRAFSELPEPQKRAILSLVRSLSDAADRSRSDEA